MSERVNVQTIGALAWCLILTVAGGALILGALGGPPGEAPATVTAETAAPPAFDEELDGALFSEDERRGLTHVSRTE